MIKYNSTLRGLCNLKGINLQLFNDGGDSTEPPTEPPTEPKTEPKTYTQEELDRLLQSETDKRVTEALKTSRAKLEEEFNKKIEDKIKETERLASLSAKEKEEELRNQKEKELADKEKAIHYRELQLDTINVLVDEELPVGFADFLIRDTAETTKENISKFKAEWQKELEKAVDEKLKGTSPRRNYNLGGDEDKEGIGIRLAKTIKRNEEIKKNNPYF